MLLGTALRWVPALWDWSQLNPVQRENLTSLVVVERPGTQPLPRQLRLVPPRIVVLGIADLFLWGEKRQNKELPQGRMWLHGLLICAVAKIIRICGALPTHLNLLGVGKNNAERDYFILL